MYKRLRRPWVLKNICGNFISLLQDYKQLKILNVRYFRFATDSEVMCKYVHCTYTRTI